MPVSEVRTSANNWVIANGQATSNALEFGEDTLVGIDIPNAFTGTALTFLHSVDGASFRAVKRGDGTDFSIIVAQNTYAKLDSPADLAGVKYLKVVSNASEGGARTLIPAVRRIL